MSALTRPRAQVVDTAIRLGRSWCEGQIIDGSPALGHALKVARKVDEHYPAATPDLIAAVIVHDAPFFTPPELDLDTTLTTMLNADVTRIVRAIEAEHDALEHSNSPNVDTTSQDVLIASAADKVISIGAILKRARRCPVPGDYWTARQPFLVRVPYFQAFSIAARPHLPNTLGEELHQVITLAADATAPFRPTGAR